MSELADFFINLFRFLVGPNLAKYLLAAAIASLLIYLARKANDLAKKLRSEFPTLHQRIRECLISIDQINRAVAALEQSEISGRAILEFDH